MAPGVAWYWLRLSAPLAATVLLLLRGGSDHYSEVGQRVSEGGGAGGAGGGSKKKILRAAGGAIPAERTRHQTPPPPPPPAPPIDPDSGVVINWTALDEIASRYAPTPPEEWLPPPTSLCSCSHLKYRPLYCPWYIKPFRDAYDLVVTETAKWPTSRKLLGCEDDADMLNGPHRTGLPMMAYFGTECCRVYANATRAYVALSDFDDCWHWKDELRECFREGHRVSREMTDLTEGQYGALVRNASYADLATPHL